MDLGIFAGEALATVYAIAIVCMAIWAVGKMITGLARGLFKS